MILLELYLVKSVVAWAATIKGVQLSVASAEQTFKEVRRKSAFVSACLHSVLQRGELPEDVRQAVAEVQHLLQDIDAIIEAGPARSALTFVPRKLNEAEELHSLELELNAALERLQAACTLHAIDLDDDVAPSPEPPEDLPSDPTSPQSPAAPPGARRQRLPEDELVDSILKQKKESQQVPLPEFLRCYMPTWETLGYRCRTSNS